jgi:hypothetical protein
LARKLPKQHGLCPSCGERFYVRRDQWVFPSVLLSRVQKESLRPLDDAFADLKQFGLVESDLEAVSVAVREGRHDIDQAVQLLHAAAMRKVCASEPAIADGVPAPLAPRCREAFHRMRETPGKSMLECYRACRNLIVDGVVEPDVPAIAWKAMQSIKIAADDHHGRSQLFFNMAMFLAYENKPCWMLLREAVRAQLMDAAAVGSCSRIELIAGRDGCKACRRISGKRMNLVDAIKDPPIPCKGCSESPLGDEGDPWCVASFVTVLD